MGFPEMYIQATAAEREKQNLKGAVVSCQSQK